MLAEHGRMTEFLTLEKRSGARLIAWQKKNITTIYKGLNNETKKLEQNFRLPPAGAFIHYVCDPQAGG
jgi:hypothetical protein